MEKCQFHAEQMFGRMDSGFCFWASNFKLKSTTIKRTNVLRVAGQIQQNTITTLKPFNVKKIRLPFSGVPYPGQKQDGAEPQLGKKVKKIL
jgi:hypothetical protein